MTDVLKIIPKYVRPVRIKSSPETKSVFSKKLTITLEQIELGTPVKDNQDLSCECDNNLYPADFGESRINYNASVSAILTGVAGNLVKQKCANPYFEVKEK